MNADVYRRMTELCEAIQNERDPEKFKRLVEELNRLLEEAQAPKSPLPKKKLTISTAA